MEEIGAIRRILVSMGKASAALCNKQRSTTTSSSVRQRKWTKRKKGVSKGADGASKRGMNRGAKVDEEEPSVSVEEQAVLALQQVLQAAGVGVGVGVRVSKNLGAGESGGGPGGGCGDGNSDVAGDMAVGRVSAGAVELTPSEAKSAAARAAREAARAAKAAPYSVSPLTVCLRDNDPLKAVYVKT